MKFFFYLMALGVLMSGCQEVNLVDGLIPAEHRNEVKLLESRYRGEIFKFVDFGNGTRQANEIQSGELQFWLDSDNRLNVATNFDFAGLNCKSKLGVPKKMLINSKNKISGLEISIDRGLCQDKVEGQSVFFEIDEDKRFIKVRLDRVKRDRIATEGLIYN